MQTTCSAKREMNQKVLHDASEAVAAEAPKQQQQQQQQKGGGGWGRTQASVGTCMHTRTVASVSAGQ